MKGVGRDLDVETLTLPQYRRHLKPNQPHLIGTADPTLTLGLINNQHIERDILPGQLG